MKEQLIRLDPDEKPQFRDYISLPSGISLANPCGVPVQLRAPFDWQPYSDIDALHSLLLLNYNVRRWAAIFTEQCFTGNLQNSVYRMYAFFFLIFSKLLKGIR